MQGYCILNLFVVLDNSAFSEVQKSVDCGFRAFSQFTILIYSQLQSILPDSSLGNISDWDNFLQLDLDQADLPYTTPDEYVLNEDFHKLVTASKLPRSSKFVEQSICFVKSFCRQLLEHGNIKSRLIRGLSAFDPAVILVGPEANYTDAIEKLTSHFVSVNLITSSVKVKVVSQYRSLAVKLRSGDSPEYDDWITFLTSHYELQCRPELFQLFKYSCLCLPPRVVMPPEFIVPMADLESGEENFQSCIKSLQMSYSTIPHVSSLYRDPKSVSRVFRLLGRGADFLADRKFSIWNFLRGSATRRTSLLGKLETGYRKAVLQHDRPIVSSTTTTPSVSRTGSVNSSPSPDPSLSRISVSLIRCSSSSVEDTGKKSNSKFAKNKKN